MAKDLEPKVGMCVRLDCTDVETKESLRAKADNYWEFVECSDPLYIDEVSATHVYLRAPTLCGAILKLPIEFFISDYFLIIKAPTHRSWWSRLKVWALLS